MIDTNYVKNTNELRKNAIIKYKVKYPLYLKIFLLRNKKEAAYSDSPFGDYETQPVAFTI